MRWLRTSDITRRHSFSWSTDYSKKPQHLLLALILWMFWEDLTQIPSDNSQHLLQGSGDNKPIYNSFWTLLRTAHSVCRDDKLQIPGHTHSAEHPSCPWGKQFIQPIPSRPQEGACQLAPKLGFTHYKENPPSPLHIHVPPTRQSPYLWP